MKLPIYIDGKEEGALTVERQGAATVMRADMRDVGRVVRLTVYGERLVSGRPGAGERAAAPDAALLAHGDGPLSPKCGVRRRKAHESVAGAIGKETDGKAGKGALSGRGTACAVDGGKALLFLMQNWKKCVIIYP